MGADIESMVAQSLTDRIWFLPELLSRIGAREPARKMRYAIVIRRERARVVNEPLGDQAHIDSKPQQRDGI